MPNFGYHLARAEGKAVRSLYSAALGTVMRRAVMPNATVPFEVYSYSGEATLLEQVASIRSFLRHAGRPMKFTIVSDGTHSQRSIDVLHGIDRAVAVVPSGELMPRDVDMQPEMQTYLREHPTGKQLAVIMSLPIHGPALYVDSDVLFFAGARELRSLGGVADAPALYLADCQLSADQRLFRDDAEKSNPVNTGVVFVTRALDWSLAITRFRELAGMPNFFTNQTMTHLAMHTNGARAFDPGKYVLQLDDQFIYGDRYAGPALALRHYVNPVRHKFWTSLWR